VTLTRPEAVTLALYALGGADVPADTEDVAMRVAELTPGMFAWRKYPDQIDKELVRVALSDARLKKKWVVGSHDRGGWLLTPTGQEFARQNEGRLGAATEVRRSGREERQIERERIRLLTSAVYERIAAGGDTGAVTSDEADAFFRINVYVEGQARERKIARVENQFGSDPELGKAVRVAAAVARARGKT
jgi:hypothetical protein